MIVFKIFVKVYTMLRLKLEGYWMAYALDIWMIKLLSVYIHETPSINMMNRDPTFASNAEKLSAYWILISRF